MITLDERKKFRKTLETLQDFEDALEDYIFRHRKVPEKISSALIKLTGTEEEERQLIAITNLKDKIREQFDEKLAEAAPHSLSCFVEYMTPDEPPANHHEFMCKHMEGVAKKEIRRSIISMPPGHAKTKFCSRYFPAWYLGKHPYHKFIQGGHSQDFVEKQFGGIVRNIIREEKFKKVFPEVKISNDSSAAGYWEIAGRAGSYLAKGVGQGISGFRGHIACVDDPYAKYEDAMSSTIRDKVFNWFSADFSTRLLPNSPIFIVSTRWHSDDLCGRLEKIKDELGQKVWHIINLPAVATEDNDVLGRKIGDVLWPEFYDINYLLNLRISSQIEISVWNSLYQGCPTDQQSGVINSEIFSRYKYLPIHPNKINGQKETHAKSVPTSLISGNALPKDYEKLTQSEINDSKPDLFTQKDEKPEILRRITLSVDSASKTSERNDFTVITVWYEAQGSNKHYLAEVIRKRMEFDEMANTIDKIATRYNANEVLVEDKGSGTQYIQTRRGIFPIPITPIIPKGDKQFRFDGVIPMFTSGQVLLPESAPWLSDYELELAAFPNGTFDDQVDSTSQYLNYKRKNAVYGSKKMRGTF